MVKSVTDPAAPTIANLAKRLTSFLLERARCRTLAMVKRRVPFPSLASHRGA